MVEPRLRAEDSGKKVGVALPRLLVVDDETNQARVMAIGLRIEGFDVEVVSDAKGAMRIMADQQFDVAVVDLMLPETNGIQLARILRDLHPTVRIVLTSAYHVSEHQLFRVDCGAVGFVAKPFDLTELARFLRSKLPPGGSGRPFASPGAAA